MEELKIRSDVIYNEKVTLKNGQEIMVRDRLPVREEIDAAIAMYARTYTEDEENGLVLKNVDAEVGEMYVYLRWFTNVDVDYYAAENMMYELFDELRDDFKFIYDGYDYDENSGFPSNDGFLNVIMKSQDVARSRKERVNPQHNAFVRVCKLIDNFPTQEELSEEIKQNEIVNSRMIDILFKAEQYDKEHPQKGKNVVPIAGKLDLSKKKP